jgi:membrane protein DedA with SNARE-associated domain
MEWAPFIAAYGVWLVAAFIALESIGAPLPAEAALIAAAVYAATTQDIDIGWLLTIASLAAIAGNIAGYWLGRRYGYRLLMRYGHRLGLTEGRIKIGQWLFLRYGGRFVFVARFLPFLRNMAAVLAGAHRMPKMRFCLASSAAAVAWVLTFGLAAYAFGDAFAHATSPATLALAAVALLIVVALPVVILRWEKRLLAQAEHGLPDPPVSA